jgi:hypothetical protein
MNREGYLTWAEMAEPFVELGLYALVVLLAIRIVFALPKYILFVMGAIVLWLAWVHLSGYIDITTNSI